MYNLEAGLQRCRSGSCNLPPAPSDTRIELPGGVCAATADGARILGGADPALVISSLSAALESRNRRRLENALVSAAALMRWHPPALPEAAYGLFCDCFLRARQLEKRGVYCLLLLAQELFRTNGKNLPDGIVSRVQNDGALQDGFVQSIDCFIRLSGRRGYPNGTEVLLRSYYGFMAVTHSRRREMIECIAEVLRSPGLSSHSYDLAATVLAAGLAYSSQSSYSQYLRQLTIALLADARVPPPAFRIIARAFNEFLVRSRHKSVKAEALAAMGERNPAIAADHLVARVFQSAVVEPVLFKQPEDLSPERLERTIRHLAASPDLKYFLAFTANHPQLNTESRAWAAARLEQSERGPLQDYGSAVLARGPRRVLLLNNIADGQGDELIRNTAILQALVDLNPQLSVTVVTRRDYLYDHPRVRVVAASSRTENFRTLVEGGPFDLIVNHFDVRYCLSRRLALTLPPALLKLHSGLYVRTDKASDDFLIQELHQGGKNFAPPLGLNKVRAGSVYDPSYRLLSVLGIPFLPPGCSPGESFLTAKLNGAADNEWERLSALVQDGSRPAFRRPIVVCNPFGGEFEAKGFMDRPNYTITLKYLRDSIERMVAKNYSVVLLPNGTGWGSPTAAQAVREQLTETAQRYVAVAPDPRSYPRAYKYFAKYADLIVTVEGGFMHLAFALGKPFVMVRAIGAGPSKWVPDGGPHQIESCVNQLETEFA